MFVRLFETWEQRDADLAELQRLREKYGDELVIELRQRVRQSGITSRNKRHWQRILKKAQAGEDQ